ncbi:hypothetical protein [Archangium sp.]|uniref:hypothetical protein n=1 Tax=Archangium sp. TaxID=1872627 RepID=UPI002D2969B1|nr:hypothetical protein [Archangium sp.]HYO56863.1 hypothetical protein [Archangium sp.]
MMLKTGCPALGEAGVLHQAMLKDTIEGLAKDKCDQYAVLNACGDDGFDACMEECKKAMKRKARK